MEVSAPFPCLRNKNSVKSNGCVDACEISSWSALCNKSSMLLSLVTIHPLPGDESKVIDVLDSMQRLIATSLDCQGCLITTEAGTGKSICYMERWRTREALDRHLRSTLYCRVLEAMELSRIPPTVEFFEITGIGGLDLIERVRLHPVDNDKSEPI